MLGFCPDARHPTFPEEDITTMKTSLWKRTVSMALALILLCAAPVTAMAAEKTFTLIQLAETDVELDQTAFQYTGQEIRPNVTVRVQDRLLTLDKDYTLEYADNIEIGTGKVIVTGIATASETVGYTGTVEIPFQITKEAPAYTLIQLKGTDVTIDGTSFPYTGSPIEPAITVTVEGKTLTAGKDYSLSYRNNVEVGTGTVIVSGIATASEILGYTGTVEIDFTITPAVYELKGTDVTIEGTSFPYTGSYIEPKVTVTVNGRELVRDEHYTLSYHNNLGAGTATASVNGIVSAGYTGQVNIDFTIEKDPEETQPETTEPDATEPETSIPEVTQPESDSAQSVEYKITKGDKSTWYRQSTKNLSFTANGSVKSFEGVKIDGKDLAEKYYAVESGSTVVTLKKDFLQKLSVGKHTITILFGDGQAEGSFRVSEGLDATNPETGDDFSMGLWMAVMGLSLAGGIGMIVFRKKLFS